MIITYHGIECFRVQFGDMVLVFNPISENSQFKPARVSADIALSTTAHPDLNGFGVLKSTNNNELFTISGPGEYEVNEVTIKGFPTSSEYDGKERINSAYKVILEKIKIMFMGAISSKELPEDLSAESADVDILFVPVGGNGVLGPSEASKLAVDIAPHIVIPMHYGKVGEKDALQSFLKERGYKELEAQEKLTVKPKDLEQKEGEVVVLSE